MSDKILFDFSSNELMGNYPTSLVIVESIIYGVAAYIEYTGQITSIGNGIIFSYDLNSGSFKNLYQFKGTDGSVPSSLIYVDGILYGTTTFGGNTYGSGNIQSGYGTIFSFSISDSKLNSLNSFNGSNGCRPNYLTYKDDGLLYGHTGFGGNGFDPQNQDYGYNGNGTGYGTLFYYDLNANGGEFKNIHSFENSDGCNPFRSVFVGDVLYGITCYGGIGYNNDLGGNGTIFSYDTIKEEFNSTYDPSKDYFFDGNNASFPSSITNVDGLLYITTGPGENSNGGLYGNIISYDPTINTFKKLITFNGSDTIKGCIPTNLVKVNDNTLYGTTLFGGNLIQGTKPFGYGTLFCYDINKGIITTKIKFDGTNSIGFGPYILKNKDGILYGTASVRENGKQNAILYSYDLKLTQNVLYEFDDNSIVSSILKIGDTIYGVVNGVNGESNSYAGSLFSYDITNDEKILYQFKGSDGYIPSSLIYVDGILYGTTSFGGKKYYTDGIYNSGYGTVFSFNISEKKLTTLHEFKGTNGSRPNYLTYINGILYGSTGFGGSGFDVQNQDTGYNGNGTGLGTFFSYDTTIDNFKKLHDFKGTDGCFPYKTIYLNELIYGITTFGGNGFNGIGTGNGTIFCYDPSNEKIVKSILFDGDGDNIYFPTSLTSVKGILYGTTEFAGSQNFGTLFSYDTSKETVTTPTTIISFGNSNGAFPTSLINVDGILYGVTTSGGIIDKNKKERESYGTIFSYDPSKDEFKPLLFEFDGTNGNNPIDLINDNGLLYGTAFRNGPPILYSYKPDSTPTPEPEPTPEPTKKRKYIPYVVGGGVGVAAALLICILKKKINK